MPTKTRKSDPTFIADRVRMLRDTYGLTQESLAALANLTTRTIENVESGRKGVSEQTLRSIARAFNLDARYFQQPSPEEEIRFREALERARVKTVITPTKPIRSAGDALELLGERHAFRIDTSRVSSDEALEATAILTDLVTDLCDIWGDLPATERLRYAREVATMCGTLEEEGYLCHGGSHRQQLRERGRPRLVFTVGLLSILPKAESQETRFALVELDGAWETLEEDRLPEFEATA